MSFINFRKSSVTVLTNILWSHSVFPPPPVPPYIVSFNNISHTLDFGRFLVTFSLIFQFEYLFPLIINSSFLIP